MTLTPEQIKSIAIRAAGRFKAPSHAAILAVPPASAVTEKRWNITSDSLMIRNPDGSMTFQVLRSGNTTSDATRGGTWYQNKLWEGQKSAYDTTNLRGGVPGVGGKGTTETTVTVYNPYFMDWGNLGEAKAVIVLGEEVLGVEEVSKLSKGIKGSNAEKSFARLENAIMQNLSAQGYDSVLFTDKHIEGTVLPKQLFKFNNVQTVAPAADPVPDTSPVSQAEVVSNPYPDLKPMEQWMRERIATNNPNECKPCVIGPVVQWYYTELKEQGFPGLAKSLEDLVDNLKESDPEQLVILCKALDDIKKQASEKLRLRLMDFDAEIQSYNIGEFASEGDEGSTGEDAGE